MSQPSKKEIEKIKKAVATPHIPLTNRTYKIKDSMDNRYGGFGGMSRPENELDKILKDAAKVKAQRIKDLQIKKIELEMEKDVQNLEKSLAKGGPAGGGSMLPTPQDLAFLDSLPPERRPMALQAMASFRNQAGAEGGLGSLLAVAMLQGKQQEPMTIDKMVTGMKGMQDMIMTGRPQGMGDMNTMIEMVKLVSGAKDVAYTTQIDLLRKDLEERSPYNPLQYHKDLIDTARGMGMKMEGASTPEIEIMRIEMEKFNNAEDRKWRQFVYDQNKKDERTNLLLEKAFDSPLIARLIPQGNPQQPTQRQPLAQTNPENVALICPHCNFQPVWVPAANPVGTCDNCGKGVMQQGYQPPGGQPPASPGGSQRPPPPGGYRGGSPPTGPPG